MDGKTSFGIHISHFQRTKETNQTLRLDCNHTSQTSTGRVEEKKQHIN